MSFAKILCPTDFSPGSRQALRVAVRLANDAGAELVVAHAWHVPTVAYSELTFPAETIQAMADDAERGLAAVVDEAKAAGAKRVTSKLLTGLPWAEIVDELGRGYDLCVIGTHGRTGLSRILLGSVAESVIRHAPCSVLAVRPDSDVGAFKHVLVPTDFSESADHALALASTLAPATIKLLHVLELPIAYSGRMPVEGLERTLDEHAARALDKRAAGLADKTRASISKQSRIGYPGAQTLAELDHDRSIDLVVVGSHGRTGLKRALLGSVAEKVVRHARCPVLVARKRTA